MWSLGAGAGEFRDIVVFEEGVREGTQKEGREVFED